MKYLRGPWIWKTDDPAMPHWAPPEGFAGLDIRTLPEQSQAGGTPGLGIFYGRGDPGSDYDVLAEGSWYDAKADKRMRDAIPGKYRPQGDDLIGLLFDAFTNGADPLGLDAPKPIMPTMEGRLELHLGQSHYERFKWGGQYTNKVRDVVRNDFAETMRDSLDGKMKDRLQHLRVMDFLCEKFGVEDWKEFVPVALQKDVPGRVKHETTITESFNTADSGTLGPDLTWTEVLGTWNIVSSQAALAANQNIQGSARAESDLSSADHYAAVDITSLGTAGNSNQARALSRFSLSAQTYYYVAVQYSSASGGTARQFLLKSIATTHTSIAGPTGFTISMPVEILSRSNGSTISGDRGGAAIHSVTDTSITGNVRCGIGAVAASASQGVGLDDFEASDLAASGILYTQLERNVRGMNRGLYTGY